MEIEQVLLNLFRNAAQAMAEVTAEFSPTIIVRTAMDSGFVTITVQDNGPGGRPEQKLRVFEPFYTTKPPGLGTGLGLSVSYFIITQNHQGTFTVKPFPGQGASFVIGLPLPEVVGTL